MSHIILCFGEILWDCLPAGLFLGGAPVNVAYHLRQLGQDSRVMTAVGDDVLGEETRRRLEGWGMPLTGVRTAPRRPTGTVRVTIRSGGGHSFYIVPGVAWDDIHPSPAALRMASQSAAIVYGSLSQRTAANRRHLARVLAASQGALRIFDVNLRPPHDDLALVMRMAQEADLIKLNDEELAVLVPTRSELRLELRARRLADRTGCPRICVTAGARGAGVLWDDRWHWQQAARVRVVDTVGAGDAFLAAFLDAQLRGRTVSEALKRACQLAAFVASRPGAQPAHQ